MFITSFLVVYARVRYRYLKNNLSALKCQYIFSFLAKLGHLHNNHPLVLCKTLTFTRFAKQRQTSVSSDVCLISYVLADMNA